MSYCAGGRFTAYTGDLTRFVNSNGLAGLQSAGATNLISPGLVFKDPERVSLYWLHAGFDSCRNPERDLLKVVHLET